jgi:7-cyano-7-deazaguanine synthase
MKSLVLHSGGLDSTVCLLMAIEAGRDVVSVGVDYGQRHRVELDYAGTQCTKYGIERRILKVEWQKPARTLPTGRSVQEIRSGVSPAFLPGRNGVFLMLACAEACGVGAAEVWTGINSIDFSGYPDCRTDFLDSFKAMIRIAVPDGPEIVAPLMTLSKQSIAAEAKRLGLGPMDTWSCYQPRHSGPDVSPCGECDACVLHDLAWRNHNSA